MRVGLILGPCKHPNPNSITHSALSLLHSSRIQTLLSSDIHDAMASSDLPEYSLSKLLKSSPFHSPNHLKSIHSLIIKLGLSHSTVLITSLMNSSLKSNLLSFARKLFDELPHRDLITWTSMVTGHAHLGFYHQSLSFLKRMVKANVAPNEYSFSGALTACSGLKVLKLGQEIHAQVIKTAALGRCDSVVYNGLIGFYTKCHSLTYAKRLFGLMPDKGIFTWNEMMSGYLCNGEAESVLKSLGLMVSEGIRPDGYSYAICLDACSTLALMRQGVQIHSCLVKSGFDQDLVVRNSLLDMYAKCGCIASAKLVFYSMPLRDPVLWTAMISALGKCGFVREAIALFEEIGTSEIVRDEISYLAVLSACSHGGLVKEGWHYFQSMAEEGKIICPKEEHYGCMVDLLGRSGRLDEALEFIKGMPVAPSAAIWSSFLNSCRMHGNVELGRFAASQLLEVDPENHSNWVILSSIHAWERNWTETWRVRQNMKGESMKKEPGCSWVEVKDGVHVFLTADRRHPELYEILHSLYTFEKDPVMISA